MASIHLSRFGFPMYCIVFSSFLLELATIPIAFGEPKDPKDESALVAQVDPCVATVVMGDESEGSGFLVDSKGLLLTNYHVIEGAKTATVTFPDKRQYSVDGYVAIEPSKDLALVHLAFPNAEKNPNAQGNNPNINTATAAEDHPVLKLSGTVPAKGERVFAFGAPLGLSGSVSNGIVAAVRTGKDVSDTLNKLTHKDIYGTVLGYDLNAEWIQITAPISPGNSGGPLVNASGEVVGINTWVCSVGQNLNFSLSVKDIKTFMSNAGEEVRPLSSLPAPRHNREEMMRGDPKKTLQMWITLNRMKNNLVEKTTLAEKRLAKIVPFDPRNKMRGKANRDKKKANIYEELTKVYGDYAAELRALDMKDIDSALIVLSVSETALAQQCSDTCNELAEGLGTPQSDFSDWEAKWKMRLFRDSGSHLRTMRDIVRMELNRKYDMNFPTLEQTAKDDGKESGNKDQEKPDDSSLASKTELEGDSEDKSTESSDSLRTWTDRSGRHQIQAKYLGLEAGKVKLKKADGTVVSVPIDSLSEADQRFIGVVP